MAASDPIKDYGAYRPTAWVKALLALSQRTVLGRGKARRWIAKRLHAAHSGPLDVVLWGQPARVHVGRNTNEVKALLNPARFNRAELDLVRQYMPRRGGVFVDVGANAGMVSLAARAGMETGTLLCIEPQPEMFRRLRFNLEARRAHGGVRVVLVQAALGPQLGRARLAVPAQPGMASLARLDTEIADHVDVDMRRLDQLCQSADLGQIDALKIDVEGYEDQALLPLYDHGPEALWPRLVILEHCHARRWSRDVTQELLSLGYSILRQDRQNICLARGAA